jgi:hypothetical protein
MKGSLLPKGLGTTLSPEEAGHTYHITGFHQGGDLRGGISLGDRMKLLYFPARERYDNFGRRSARPAVRTFLIMRRRHKNGYLECPKSRSL